MLLKSVFRQRFRRLHLNSLASEEVFGELVALVHPMAMPVDQDILAEVQIPERDVRLASYPRRRPGQVVRGDSFFR